MDEEHKKRKHSRIFYLGLPAAVTVLIILLIRHLPSPEITPMVSGIILVVLFVVGFILESRYIEYVGLLPSIVTLYFITWDSWNILPALMKAYIISGTLICMTTFLIYYNNRKKTGRLYDAVFYTYSLKTVLAIYISRYVMGSYLHPYFIYAFILFYIITWGFYLESGV